MSERISHSIQVHDIPASRTSYRSRRFLSRKVFAGVLGFLLLGAILAPIAQNWRANPRDSVPFSYYPMFSVKRGDSYVVNYMVGLDGQGKRHTIPFWFAGNGGHNQTRRQIDRLVREGKAAMLCESVADKVRSDAELLYSHMVAVQIITGEFRFDHYFNGNKTPLKEQMRATCQVTRTEQAKEVGH
jgi:hypothetical protein